MRVVQLVNVERPVHEADGLIGWSHRSYSGRPSGWSVDGYPWRICCVNDPIEGDE
jgi:hypothetical protein